MTTDKRLEEFHRWAKIKGWGISGEPNPDKWPYAAWVAWQAWKECWNVCHAEKPIHFRVQ